VRDEEGRPISGPVVQLFRNVMHPGQSHHSFGTLVDTLNEIAVDGTYTFSKLIPGATYNTRVEVRGHATSTSQHVDIKPGQEVRLDDYLLPVADQEVSGVVVDASGKPLSGAAVSIEQTRQGRALYAPSGAVWFQDTDESGRFHLTGLPRGEIRLMAYRRPDAADRAIHNLKYADVSPGQTDVRIELPDSNDRLRGIE
jgi:hypothetical protein